MAPSEMSKSPSSPPSQKSGPLKTGLPKTGEANPPQGSAELPSSDNELLSSDSSDPDLFEDESDSTEEDEEGENNDDGSEGEEEERKMILVVRSDLGMSIGKTAAQVGHAVHRLLEKSRTIEEEEEEDEKNGEEPHNDDKSPQNNETAMSPNTKKRRKLHKMSKIKQHQSEIWFWENLENSCYKKVTLEVNSYEEICRIRKRAKAMKIMTATIRDAGHTEIASGSVTVLGLGPAKNSLLNEVTGKLKTLSDPSKLLKKDMQKKDQQIAKLEKQLQQSEKSLQKVKQEKTTLIREYGIIRMTQ